MASRKRTPEQKARLRAVRHIQDDVYEGIGADRLYGDGGEDGVARQSDPRDEARSSARRMTIAGTEPLRELRAEDDDSMAKKRRMKGY